MNTKEYCIKKNQSGLCRSCTNSLDTNGTKCSACQEKDRRRDFKYRESSRESNLCITCHKNQVSDGHVVCNDCMIRSREYGKSRRSKFDSLGLCTSCGAKHDDPAKKGCASCRKKAAESTARKTKISINTGICQQCKKPIESSSSSKSLCFSCCTAAKERSFKSHSRSVYDGLRGKIIDRDKACVICNKPYTGRNSGLVVHHIDSDRSHNTEDNLIVLCKNCHILVTYWISNPNKEKALNFILTHYSIVKEQ